MCHRFLEEIGHERDGTGPDRFDIFAGDIFGQSKRELEGDLRWRVGGEEAGVAESVKSASDVFSPVTGEVIAVNEALEDEPERVNEDPYGEGWMFRVRMTDPGELDGLMDAAAYAEHIADHD